ncbi:uncharacterized protein LOC105836573 [Monomorium pharaonis]|uniref:uncharacterized protein LOC105836573 n=1 Tax=Monomorium pharaonis TaxID=307658 RepID=UPI00102E1ABD|nr:uncharacterized protein LOC105836573 [Monomorium pharaonis]
MPNEQVDKEYEQGDTDHEVENVKSAWQALRGEKDWTKGKDRIDNARTKKLYEILKRMTSEVDRVQKSYINPKANYYLHKSATNVLGMHRKPSLQEEAEIIRSAIFPDRKAKAKSVVSHLANVDSEIIDRNVARIRFNDAAEDEQPHKNLPSSKYSAKRRSVHVKPHDNDLTNDVGSVHAIANTSNKKEDVTIIMKPTVADSSNKTRARIKSSIEEYLQRYADNIHASRKFFQEKKDGCPRYQDVEASADDIADILASHGIESHALYENFEKHSDDSEVYDEDRFSSNIATNVTCTTSVDAIQENRQTCDNKALECTGLCNDTRPTKAIDTKSVDTRGQSSVTNYQDNAFIKLGLNENLSKDTLSQILQSEYLRKDLSL